MLKKLSLGVLPEVKYMNQWDKEETEKLLKTFQNAGSTSIRLLGHAEL